MPFMSSIVLILGVLLSSLLYFYPILVHSLRSPLNGVIYASLTSTDSSFLSGLILGICISFIILVLNEFDLFPSRSKGKEPYGLEHVLLNVDVERGSHWLNMGYWKDTNQFPAACQALALKLAGFIGLKPGLDIEEVGFGCGDSLRLWLDKFPPRTLRGLTSLQTQLEIAQTKLEGSPHTEADHQNETRCTSSIDLKLGDAVNDPGRWWNGEQNRVDVMFAIDCAYHFATRNRFLSSAFRRLRPGGTLALTDILLPCPSSQLSLGNYLVHRMVCLIASVPWENMIDVEEYKKRLIGLGFEGVEIEDTTEWVFDGLAGFIERRDRGIDWSGKGETVSRKRREFEVLKAGGRNSDWTKFVWFAKVLRWWGRGNAKFVMVKAKRPLP